MATTSRLPASSSTVLQRFLTMNRQLADLLPARIGLKQLLMFSLVGYANAAGRDLTLTEIRQLAGKGSDGEDLLGASIERTYAIFMAPTKRYPDGLGWMTQVGDPDDRRKKFLKLTPTGAAVFHKLINLLTEVGGVP